MVKTVIICSLIKNADNINKEYFCKYCNDVFNEVYQIECGCRSCIDCVTSRFNITFCSNCNQPINPKIINKDKAFQKELNILIVNCNQCTWTGRLCDFFEHLKEHPVKRESVPEQELANSIANIYENFNPRVSCLENALIENRNQNTSELVADDATQAGRAFNDESRSSNQNILKNLEDLEEKETLIRNDINQNTNKCENLINEAKTVTINQESLRDVLVPTKQTLIYAQAALVSLNERLSVSENASFTGTFNWKITKIEEKIQEAQLNKESSCYSSPFYTSQYGYKLCGKLTFNTSRNQLSLSIVVMKGEYDSLLEWPFKQKITFILIDQPTPVNKDSFDYKDTESIIQTFKANPDSDSFRKPTTDMNPPSGIPEFCSITKLKSNSNHYIADDCMFIKIIVDIRGIKIP